jgi:hypothetical protein
MKQSKLKPNLYQQGGFSPVQLSSSEFIPTYAGVPLQEAERYGEGLTKMYHQNIADLTKLDIMNANRKVLKGDEAMSEEYNKYLKAQMEDMAKKGDYENMGMRVNALAREFVNHKDLKAMAESRAAADQDLEMRNKLRLAGQTPWFEQDIDAHQTIQVGEDGKKTYNIYKPTTEAKLKHQEKRAAIWDVMKADAGPLKPEEVRSNIPAIQGFISTGSWKGISGGTDAAGNPTGKIGRLINHAMTSYKSTAEYDQEKRKDIQDLTAQGYSQEEATAEAEKLARKRMFSEGMLRTFSEVDAQYLQDWMMKAQAEGGEGSTTKPALETGLKVGDIDFYKDLALDQYTENQKGIMKARGYGAKISKEDFDKAGMPTYERYTPEQRTKYESVARAAITQNDPEKLKEFYKDGSAAEITKATEDERKFLYSPEVYNQVQTYLKDIENRLYFNTVEEFAATPKGQQLQKAATDQLQTSFHRKVFYDFDTKK